MSSASNSSTSSNGNVAIAAVGSAITLGMIVAKRKEISDSILCIMAPCAASIISIRKRKLIDENNNFRNLLTDTEEIIERLKNELAQLQEMQINQNRNDQLDMYGLAKHIIEDLEGTVGMAKIVTQYIDVKARERNIDDDVFNRLPRFLNAVMSVFDRHIKIVRNIKDSSDVPLGTSDRFRQLVQRFQSEYGSIKGFELAKKEQLEKWAKTSPKTVALWAKWGKIASVGLGGVSTTCLAIFVMMLGGPVGYSAAAFGGAVTAGVGAYYCYTTGKEAKLIQYDQYWMQMKAVREQMESGNITLDDLEEMLDLCNIVVADKYERLDCLIEMVEQCSICEEKFTEIECKDQNNTNKNMVTPSVCDHRYHRHCLLKWSNQLIARTQPPHCPQCRRIFHPNQISLVHVNIRK